MFVPDSVAPLVGYFNIKQTLFNLPGVTTKLLGQNPERIFISITTQAGGIIRISNNPAGATSGDGIIIAGSSNLFMDFRTFGAFISGEIWAFASVPIAVTIFEILYRPPAGE